MGKWTRLSLRFLAVGVGIFAIAGAGIWLLLPDEYVVRGPMIAQLFGRVASAPSPEIVELRLQPPAGYNVTIWAQGLGDVRIMRFSPDGSLLVSQPRLGQILHVLDDRDGDGLSDGQQVFASGLDLPTGIDFYNDWLYIAEAGAIAAMIADGETEIAEAFVIADSPFPVSPCGGCRQKLAEFSGPEVKVTLATTAGLEQTVTIADMLPGAFTAAYMEPTE